MTPEEITKLAEEYGVDKANCISFSAYSDAKVKRMLASKSFANEAMRVLTWLSEHYCIVEKSKEETSEEVTIDGWVARDRDGDIYVYWDEPITSFPSLTWESDPLEVTITIKPKKKQ